MQICKFIFQALITAWYPRSPQPSPKCILHSAPGNSSLPWDNALGVMLCALNGQGGPGKKTHRRAASGLCGLKEGQGGKTQQCPSGSGIRPVPRAGVI